MKNEKFIKWKRSDFFFEARLSVPVLGMTMDVWVEPENESDKGPSPAQLRALQSFLLLACDQKDEWTHQVAMDCYHTCQRAKMEGGKPPVSLRQRKAVWKHVRLKQVLIPAHGKSGDRYVFVDGECDWEQEHGLELLFKNERLFKVGPQEGLSANEEWQRYYINE
jgi:hypothetical protein